jgi:hypothetical protein
MGLRSSQGNLNPGIVLEIRLCVLWVGEWRRCRSLPGCDLLGLYGFHYDRLEHLRDHEQVRRSAKINLLFWHVIVTNTSACSHNGLTWVPVIVHATATVANLICFFTRNTAVVYMCFLAFELTVGMFYPAYGSLKSVHVPEEVRAVRSRSQAGEPTRDMLSGEQVRSGVMNIFRISLNFVIVVLLGLIEVRPGHDVDQAECPDWWRVLTQCDVPYSPGAADLRWDYTCVV